MLNRTLYNLYRSNGFSHQQVVSWYSEQLNQELEIDPDDLSVWSLTNNCWVPQSAVNRASDGVEYSRQSHDFVQAEMPDLYARSSIQCLHKSPESCFDLHED